MDATKIPKGQAKEVNGDGRAYNLPGIYIHKDTKYEYITAEGEEGSIQADALMSPIWQGAWEWTADVPSRTELLAIRKAQEIKEAKEEAQAKKAEEAELKAAIEADEVQPGGENYEPTVTTKAK